MNKPEAAQKIIAAALPHVPFDGWTQGVLSKAAQEAGYKSTDAIRVFSGGAIDAVDFYARQCDAGMVEALGGYNLDTMKIREKIALAVRLRLMAYAPHREAARKALKLQASPIHAGHALKSLYRTVDEIWFSIGDTSTNFNFYTKRLTLSAVYSATLLHWLDDNSPDFSSTWEFLDRRIENVMQFEKLKHRVRGWIN
ncbi:MAG: COQ9 family protein [Alphaproteobacteria bacterium]|nr:COQ9 family protein [Alphaproteobacteria bacterium]